MSREKAIEFGKKWLQINEYWKGNSTYAFFQIAIKALEQEPRKGHWIPHTDRGMIECSECHAEERTAHLLHSNFCPNCGIKMAESEE